jgi:hypothetical protein
MANDFLLCGARLPGWLAAFDLIGLESKEQYRQRGPQRWLTEEHPVSNRNFDLQVYPEKGLDLLAALPDLDVVVKCLTRSQPPAGGNWDRLTSSGDWKATPGLVIPDGLYRNPEHTYADYLLKIGSKFLRARSREEKSLVWWWQQLRQRHFKPYYDRKLRFLLLPHLVGARLPLMIERGLCSCSGLLPSPGQKRHWAYSGVDQSRAQQFARIFQCELEVN